MTKPHAKLEAAHPSPVAGVDEVRTSLQIDALVYGHKADQVVTIIFAQSRASRQNGPDTVLFGGDHTAQAQVAGSRAAIKLIT